jgi:transcriptional regulator GlxA family with amidase domain
MSISAKSKRVIFVCFEGVQLLDLAGPADVFSIANIRNNAGYTFHYVGTSSGVRTENDMQIQVDKLPKVEPSDIVFVPGGMNASISRALQDARLLKWLKDASTIVHRMASVCSGAFILAEIGVLNGKRAVTHWAAVERLAEEYPKLKVEKDAIFIEDGKIWTSAGVTTGIDMALAMVRKDMGNELTLQIARDLVVQVIRAGNQSQYSAPLLLQKHSVTNLENLIPWLESQMSASISVVDMADQIGMSERQFYRQCLVQFGRTPAKLSLELKLDHGRNLLQDETIPIAIISEMCGFSTGPAFSKAFKKQFGTSPMAFRNHWAVK